jgi:hypothetical protein
MKQRNISRQKVEACINNPDETYPDNDDKGCKIYGRAFPDGRIIRVVVNGKNPAQKVIVTAIEQRRLTYSLDNNRIGRVNSKLEYRKYLI